MKIPQGFSGYLSLFWGIPLVVDITYVFLFGVNMPWMDQFNFIPLLAKPVPTVFFSHEFFLQHNEHKMFFPRFIMVILGHLTKYNVVAEMYFIQLLLLGSLGILFLELRRHFSFRLNGNFFIWFLPVPFLVFSLRQHVNLLFGFQIQQACVLFLSMLSFFLIERLRDSSSTRRNYGIFAGAVLSTFLGSFSSAGGLLVWPVACFQLLLLEIEKRQKKRLIFLWSGFGMATWCLYFFNYQKPSQHPSTLYAIHHPLEAIGYFFAYIGGSVFEDIGYAVVAGVIVALVSGSTLVLMYREGKLRQNSFWLAVIGLAYITACAAVVSRSGFGISQASSSKYTTFSIPILLVLYVFQVGLFLSRKRDGRSLQLGIVLTLILLGVLGSSGEAIRYARDERGTRLHMVRTLRYFEDGPARRLAPAHPEVSIVVRGAKVLEELHYSMFADDSIHRRRIRVQRIRRKVRDGEPTLFQGDFESGRNSAWGRAVGER